MSMNTEQITIGKKLVWPRKPYIPDDRLFPEYVGRHDEIKMVTAAWLGGASSQPLSPLLVGSPGCGKNHLVFAMAKLMNLDVYVCQGYENVTAEELACTLMPSDKGNGQIDYLLSALATAMSKGGICFIDEIGKFPGKALALLASVLDDRRYIDLDLIGERIHAHPQFRFIAATNSEDVEALPDFIRSRLFPVIRIEKPDHENINTIIKLQFPAQQQRVEELLTSFWLLWDKTNEFGEMPSPRDVIQIFLLASRLADYDALGGYNLLNAEPFSEQDTMNKITEARVPSEAHLMCALSQFLESRVGALC